MHTHKQTNKHTYVLNTHTHTQVRHGQRFHNFWIYMQLDTKRNTRIGHFFRLIDNKIPHRYTLKHKMNKNNNEVLDSATPDKLRCQKLPYSLTPELSTHTTAHAAKPCHAAPPAHILSSPASTLTTPHYTSVTTNTLPHQSSNSWMKWKVHKTEWMNCTNVSDLKMMKIQESLGAQMNVYVAM